MEKKGTLTKISSMFRHKKLSKLRSACRTSSASANFSSTNSRASPLINLVQKLPDQTHHNIMVPFGKAAFFPGRLIHTNEFMAFTGSIVEHAHNIGMQLPQPQGGLRGSKPVSRFKMMQQRK